MGLGIQSGLLIDGKQNGSAMTLPKSLLPSILILNSAISHYQTPQVLYAMQQRALGSAFQESRLASLSNVLHTQVIGMPITRDGCVWQHVQQHCALPCATSVRFHATYVVCRKGM